MARIAEWRRQLARFLLGWLPILALLAVWEGVARLGFFSPFLLPSFSSAAARLLADLVSGDLLINLALTLERALAGFALAGAAGVALGVMIARVPAVRWFFDPLVSIGLPMPKIAFLPIFILWFGVFDESKIIMIAFNAVFPVIVAAAAATENIDRVMLWSARSLGANPRQLLYQIAVPAALPEIFTGLQVAMPISLIVAVICEMTMGGEGLGGALMTQMRFADSQGVFSGIIAIAIAGAALVKAMDMIRRRLLVWHQETQDP